MSCGSFGCVIIADVSDVTMKHLSAGGEHVVSMLGTRTLHGFREKLSALGHTRVALKIIPGCVEGEGCRDIGMHPFAQARGIPTPRVFAVSSGSMAPASSLVATYSDLFTNEQERSHFRRSVASLRHGTGLTNEEFWEGPAHNRMKGDGEGEGEDEGEGEGTGKGKGTGLDSLTSCTTVSVVVMEAFDFTLYDLFARRTYVATVQDAFWVLYRVAQCLQRMAEAGIQHRDVKPNNILVKLNGIKAGKPVVSIAIADWGLSVYRRPAGNLAVAHDAPHFTMPSVPRTVRTEAASEVAPKATLTHASWKELADTVLEVPGALAGGSTSSMVTLDYRDPATLLYSLNQPVARYRSPLPKDPCSPGDNRTEEAGLSCATRNCVVGNPFYGPSSMAYSFGVLSFELLTESRPHAFRIMTQKLRKVCLSLPHLHSRAGYDERVEGARAALAKAASGGHISASSEWCVPGTGTLVGTTVGVALNFRQTFTRFATRLAMLGRGSEEGEPGNTILAVRHLLATAKAKADASVAAFDRRVANGNPPKNKKRPREFGIHTSNGMNVLRRRLRDRFAHRTHSAAACSSMLQQLVSSMLVVDPEERGTVEEWLAFANAVVKAHGLVESDRFLLHVPGNTMSPMLMGDTVGIRVVPTEDVSVSSRLLGHRIGLPRRGRPVVSPLVMARIMDSVAFVVGSTLESPSNRRSSGVAWVTACAQLLRVMFNVRGSRCGSRGHSDRPGTVTQVRITGRKRRRARDRLSSTESASSLVSVSSSSSPDARVRAPPPPDMEGVVIQHCQRVLDRCHHNGTFVLPPTARDLRDCASGVYQRLAVAVAICTRSTLTGSKRVCVPKATSELVFGDRWQHHHGGLAEWVVAVTPWVPVWVTMQRPRPRHPVHKRQRHEVAPLHKGPSSTQTLSEAMISRGLQGLPKREGEDDGRLQAEPECMCRTPLPLSLNGSSCQFAGEELLYPLYTPGRASALAAFTALLMCQPSMEASEQLRIPCVKCATAFSKSRRMRGFLVDMDRLVSKINTPMCLKFLEREGCGWASALLETCKDIVVRPAGGESAKEDEDSDFESGLPQSPSREKRPRRRKAPPLGIDTLRVTASLVSDSLPYVARCGIGSTAARFGTTCSSPFEVPTIVPSTGRTPTYMPVDPSFNSTHATVAPPRHAMMLSSRGFINTVKTAMRMNARIARREQQTM